MSLLVDAVDWDGITIGGADADGYATDGFTGLARPSISPTLRPRSLGGAIGGVSLPGERTVGGELWVDADVDGDRDFSALMDIYDSMQPRPQPTDELPLSWSGLMWPGEHCVFATPTRCEWITDEDGVHEGSPGIELGWSCADPVIYSHTLTMAKLVATESPTSSEQTFEAPNIDGDRKGLLVPWARRAWDLRMTAHGSLVGPYLRVDHDDGTWEQVSFPGLELTGGQVLTVQGDALGIHARVGTRGVSGWIRSYTELGESSRVPRWWLLHPSSGDDGANACRWGATSGLFSGYVRVRGTR